MLNPDGVAIGNHIHNMQGKNLSQTFFSDNDIETFQHRAYETELIRELLKSEI